jgi:glycosyltransferase 2 family protein
LKINWRVVVGILISLVALWLIAKDVKFDQFAVALTQANYWWALPSTVFILFSIWVRGYRWRALLDNRITPSRAFNITNIGNMLNNVLPIRLGDVARAYLAGRNGDVPVMQCFSTVVVERLLDVLTVFGFLMIALPFLSADNVFTHAGTITAAMAFFAVIAMFIVAAWREQVTALAQKVLVWLPKALREALIRQGDQFLLGIQAIKPRRLVIGIALSTVVWIGWAMACWTLLAAFVPGSPWYAGVFVTCAIAFGLTIPSAPSGAGLFEAAAIAALALFEVPVDVALAYAVLLHVLVFIISAIFGVYGLHIEGQNFSGITNATRGLLAVRK